MKRLALGFLFSLWSAIALAQGCGPANPNCIVPTRPAGTNDNSSASTAFVQSLAPLNIMAFGADPTNTNDNTTAFNNAVAARSATAQCIRFPAGKYKFNSGLTVAGSFCALGDGQDNTVLTWPAALGGITVNYAGAASSVHLRDLTFTTGTTAGGNAINLQNAISNANPAVTAISDLYRVTCRGDDGNVVTDYWTICVNIGNVSNAQIENLTVQGASAPNGIGIAVIGLPGSSTFGVVYNIAKSTFNNVATCFQYGSFIQGVTWDQNNCTGFGSFGVSVPASQTGTLDQLAITNSQFNGAAGTVTDINLLTAVNHVQLTNNLFFLKANHTAVNLVNAVGFALQGNACSSASLTGTTCYLIGGTSLLGSLTGNVANGAATGISLGASATVVSVENNSFNSNTTNISNSSTSLTNTGADLPQISFTATPSCTTGSGTWTTNAATTKQVGKLVYFSLDVTLTAVGTCTTSVWQFNLPVTAIQPSGYGGLEIAVGALLTCSTRSTGLSAVVCQAGSALATGNRFNVGGVYASQ